jgi:hypothetical protein
MDIVYIAPDVMCAIQEVQQPRSRFQLEKFVVNQHDTEEMRYYQVLLELQSAYFGIRRLSLTVKKSDIEIARLRATGDEIDELTAQEKELFTEESRLALIGAQREWEHLLEIWNTFSHKYTREEIEIAQPDYWKLRLRRQAESELIGSGRMTYGQIEAMRQTSDLEPFVNDLDAIGGPQGMIDNL